MVSTRFPHTTPVICEAFGWSRAAAKKSSNVVPSSRWLRSSVSSNPVSQQMT